MSTQTITRVIALTTIACDSCGVTFAVPKEYVLARQNDGATFYCPNKHGLSYHETNADRLRRQLATEKRNSHHYESRWQEEKRSKAAIKGVLTKTKKRIGNGVCPCCNRTFQNLGQHMAGQHPDYAEGKA